MSGDTATRDEALLSLTARHRGVFGDHVVCGRRYCCGSGRIAWHMTILPKSGPIRDYWAQSGNFVPMRESMPAHASAAIPIQPFGAIAEAERRAVLSAIREWERAIGENAA
jgi:hypothetical protein